MTRDIPPLVGRTAQSPQNRGRPRRCIRSDYISPAGGPAGWAHPTEGGPEIPIGFTGRLSVGWLVTAEQLLACLPFRTRKRTMTKPLRPFILVAGTVFIQQAGQMATRSALGRQLLSPLVSVECRDS